MEEPLNLYTVKQTLYVLHTKSCMALGSPVLQPANLGLSIRSPALTPAIPNGPKTYDFLRKSLLPVTQLSF